MRSSHSTGLKSFIALNEIQITGKLLDRCGTSGPTEARIANFAVLLIEIVFKGTLQYMALVAVAVLIISSFSELKKLLDAADAQDREEKRAQDRESKNIVELKRAEKR